MLQEFDFVIIQCRYLKAAADAVPSFRPDGLDGAAILALLTTAAAPRINYLVKKGAVDAVRSRRRVGIVALHDLCVDFTAQVRSRFRKDKVLIQRLERLPVEDETFHETMVRADAIQAFWPTLPQIGTPLAAFTIGQGAVNVTLASFIAQRSMLAGDHESLPGIDQDFQKAEADVHAKQAELEDFVEAALSQGKSRYEVGTPEREVIDAVPLVSPLFPPDQAVIGKAEKTAAGTVRLEFSAPKATSYELRHRLNGLGEFATLEEEILAEFYVVSGLAAGSHEFVIVPKNSRGIGPASEAATVAV